MKNSFLKRFKVYIVEWILLISSLILMAVFLSYLLLLEKDRIVLEEKRRLATQSKIINDNVSVQLYSANEILKNIKSRLESENLVNLKAIEDDLGIFKKIFPMFGTFIITNKNGDIIASSAKKDKNKNIKNLNYFKMVENAQSVNTLYISKPYKMALNLWTISLSLMLVDKNGEFNGIVSINFNPEKLMALLDSTFYYVDNMRASLLYSDGTIFLITPDYKEILGKSFLNQQGSLFAKYKQSEDISTVYVDISDASNDIRVQSFHTIKPETINMNEPLLTVISRDYNSLFVRFNKALWVISSIFALLLISSTVGLYIFQRKRYEILIENLKKQKDKEKELKAFAYVDSLTKVSNRRSFETTLKKEWESCLLRQKYIALIMIDIDHFKNYNDFYGHQAGDKCLLDVANSLKNSLNRTYDFVARYGGEEFVVILPDINLSGARKVAEKLRKNVEQLQLPHEKSSVSNYVTISVGVSLVIPNDNINSMMLLQKADEALYISKNEGRNRVTIEELNGDETYETI